MCVDFICSNREMKLTSPRLNLVMAVGGIVWYTTVAAITIPTTDLAGATALCEVRVRVRRTDVLPLDIQYD